MWAMHAVQILCSAVGMALAARMLGLELYGVLALFIGLTGLIGGLLYAPGDELITTYVTRELAAGRRTEAGNALRYALVAAAVSRVAGFAAVALVALLFGHWLGVPAAHKFALLAYATTLISGALQNECLAVLRLANRLSFGFAASVAGALVLIGGLTAAWWTDGGLRFVAFVYAANAAVYGVGLLLGAAIGAREADIPLSLRPLSLRVPRDIVSFHTAAFLKGSVNAMYRSLDIVLIAQLTTSAQVGAYKAARVIADVAKRPFHVMAVVVQAEFSRHWYGGDRVNLRRLAVRYISVAAGLATAGFGVLAALHPTIIDTVFGGGYAAARAPLAMMILGTFVWTATVPLHVLPAAVGRAWPHSLASLAALAVQIPAICLLAPSFGAFGAAIAYTAYLLVLVAILLPFAMPLLRPAAIAAALRTPAK